MSVSAPGDAEIYINNELKGVGRWSGRLNAGLYTVEARKTSHYSSSRSVEVAAGDKRTVTLSAPAPRYGSLNISTRPIGATVSVDGTALTGTTPNIYADILIGEHTLTVAKPGYVEAEQRITVEEGKVLPVSITLTEEEKVPVAAPAARSADSQSETKNRVFTVNGVSFKMIFVEGGTFSMGSSSGDSDEQPVHSVTLSGYYIGETEVTQELWQAVMGSNPSAFTGNRRPVERVSWHDCQEFIEKLNVLTGENFRLPTEAEWEYAACGGNKSKNYAYPGSDNVGDVAWYSGNSNSTTHEVKGKLPNELGLYDMGGNVWEWCSDWYGRYSAGAVTNPQGPTSGSARIYRGGCWFYDADLCRCVYRDRSTPTGAGNTLGLRLVLPQDKEVPVTAPSARTADSQLNMGQNVKTKSEPFTVVEVMPIFPGGQTALVQYIASHLKYPPVAQENGVQGRVFVSFVVGEDGYVEDVQVIKGVDPSLDKEAVRVVKSLPRWTPGNQQGKPVRVRYSVPVTFALQ